jgi:nucleoside transporter
MDNSALANEARNPMARPLISVMMFLQFFLWGVWFATLAAALEANGLGSFGGGSYGTAPLGAIFAPLFLGLVADRFFPSQIVMGILFLVGGGLMYLAWQAAKDGNGDMMVWYFLGHMLCYMPTLGLGNTIAFSHLDRNTFPKVRVWGTIGWIAAGLVVGLMSWTTSLNILLLAAICSAVLGLYCFVLPHTPPPAAGKSLDIRTLLMFDAFRMLARPAFFVFMLCSCLICMPLAYYYGLTSNYLTNAGFEQASASMTLGQMSEIFFMLLVPFFFRRLGVKWMILVGMLAWVLRYLLFAFGAPDQVAWMLFAGIVLHGICYDFFFVTGFMYADAAAPKESRGQVQSMLVFFTQGIGMYFGYMLAFSKSAAVESQSLSTAIVAARADAGDRSYLDQLFRMFTVDMPQAVDRELISTVMEQWKTFWLLPAILAAAIAALFFVAFYDKGADLSEKD